MFRYEPFVRHFDRQALTVDETQEPESICTTLDKKLGSWWKKNVEVMDPGGFKSPMKA
jgi:hypothetical protein